MTTFNTPAERVAEFARQWRIQVTRGQYGSRIHGIHFDAKADEIDLMVEDLEALANPPMRSAESSASPYEIEAPADAQVGSAGVITKVAPGKDGWSVSYDEDGYGSMGAFVPYLPVGRYGTPLREAIEPKVGDRITFYGEGIGRPFSGIAVNNQVVFYRTPEQQAEVHRRWVMDLEAQRRREFVATKPQMDADYESLDPLFKARIDRFRAKDGDVFRAESEGYEVFCCLEAQKFAQWAQDNAPKGTSPVDYLVEHRDELDASGVVSEGHSGNTYGGARRLAAALLRHRAGEDVQV